MPNAQPMVIATRIRLATRNWTWAVLAGRTRPHASRAIASMAFVATRPAPVLVSPVALLCRRQERTGFAETPRVGPIPTTVAWAKRKPRAVSRGHAMVPGRAAFGPTEPNA